MKQKNIYMKLLIIGISLIAVQCCKNNEDDMVLATYCYKNTTLHAINISTYNSANEKSYSLPANDSLIINFELIFGSSADQFTNQDSILITFDSAKQILYRSDDTSSRNSINTDNYEYSKIGQKHHKNNYTFTENDYNNALELK